MSGNKEHLAKMLAEVKFQEKQRDKLKQKLAPAEQRIRNALKAGDRALAEKCALAFEELKQQVEQFDKRIRAAQATYETGKVQTKEFESKVKEAGHLNKLAGSLGKLADSMGTLDAGDDMLRQVEEQTALDEARLELALEDKGLDLEAPPPRTSAEDILKEFE